jgi:hypothetical protein
MSVLVVMVVAMMLMVVAMRLMAVALIALPRTMLVFAVAPPTPFRLVSSPASFYFSAA